MRGHTLLVRIDGTTVAASYDRPLTRMDVRGLLVGPALQNRSFDRYVDTVTGTVYPAIMVTDTNSSRNVALESIVERSLAAKGIPSPFGPDTGKFMIGNAVIIYGDDEFVGDRKWQ